MPVFVDTCGHGPYRAPALCRVCREARERLRGKDEALAQPHCVTGVALSSEK